MKLTEELVLLLRDGYGASFPVREDMVACVLSGAALLDLAFDFHIDTDLESLLVVNPAATGNPALDPVLKRIAGHHEVCDTRTWIGILAAEEAPAILESTLAELARGGLLTERKSRLPWRSGRLCPASEVLGESRQRLTRVLSSDDFPDPRDIALISLLDACDILPEVLPGRDVDDWRPRIAQLRKMELIGREVAGAIAAIQRSILEELRARAARFRRILLQVSIAAAMVGAAALLLPPVPVADRFGTLAERLWFDSGWQLWSGYALLGAAALALLASLCPRARPVARRGGFHWWRLAHAGIGTGCLLATFAHTGFRFGAGFNAGLMACFLAVLVFGALAGISVNGAGALRKLGVAARVRFLPLRLHRLALYLLPPLVLVHVLIVYLY